MFLSAFIPSLLSAALRALAFLSHIFNVFLLVTQYVSRSSEMVQVQPQRLVAWAQ